MGALFRVLLLVGFFAMFWRWILLVLVLAVVGVLAWCAYQRLLEQDARQRREQAALIARADRQHAQVMAGDERGIYGEFPPAVGVTR